MNELKPQIELSDKIIPVYSPELRETIYKVKEFEPPTIAKNLLVMLSGEIPLPIVGGLISCILEVFWPETEKDVWKDIENHVREVCKEISTELIQENNLKQIEALLKGMKANIKNYNEIKYGTSIKGQFFTYIMADFNKAKPIFTDFSNSKILPFFAEMATMHLIFLREQMLFEGEIYNEYIDDERKRKSKGKFYEHLKEYRDYGKKATNEVLRFAQENLKKKYLEWDNQLSTIRVNQRVNELEIEFQKRIWDVALLWSNLDPENTVKPPIPIDRILSIGPFTGLSCSDKLNPHKFDSSLVPDPPSDPISGMLIREWDLIDFIQFHYGGKAGHGFGNKRGGTPHTIKLSQGQHITAVDVWFRDILFAIQFTYNDGSQSPKFGDRGHRRELKHWRVEYENHYLRSFACSPRLVQASFQFTPKEWFSR